MGSFYARQYLCEYGQELSGAIILGTGHQPKALVQFARSTCRALAAVHGWQYRSKLVANLSFMGYNKGLEGRTTHDWLNRDAAEVDKYLADERCTFTFTLNAYYSMFSGILRLYDPAFLDRMPKDLPVLFLAGGRGPRGRAERGRQAGRGKHEERRDAERPGQVLPAPAMSFWWRRISWKSLRTSAISWNSSSGKQSKNCKGTLTGTRPAGCRFM